MPEDNRKQNPSQPYTNKYQKHVACSYGYKLVCVNDKFSKPFKTSLEKDTVYNFIKSMIAEGKYCNEVMKKFFNKKFVMTEECNENFKNSTKCWIFDNGYIATDVKVRDYCHITGKYRGSVHRDCYINLKLICKTPIAKKLWFSSYFARTRKKKKNNCYTK